MKERGSGKQEIVIGFFLVVIALLAPLMWNELPPSSQLIELDGEVLSVKDDLKGSRYWRHVEGFIDLSTDEAGTISGKISGGLDRLERVPIESDKLKVRGVWRSQVFHIIEIEIEGKTLLSYKDSLKHYKSRSWIVYVGQIFLLVVGIGLIGLGWRERREFKRRDIVDTI